MARVARILEGMNLDARNLVLRLHRRLSEPLWVALREAGIAESTVHEKLLGWDGLFLTIPVHDRERRLRRLVRAEIDPESGQLQLVSGPDELRLLYGAPLLRWGPSEVVIVESIPDCLLLHSRGFHAVAPAGEGVPFEPDWVTWLERVPEIFLCFRRGSSGVTAALAVREMLPRARILTLPPEVGENGGLFEYFVEKEHTAADFRGMLARARSNGNDA